MDIRIYQINGERDEKRVKFTRHELLEKYQGSSDIDSSIYDKVYEGNVDCKTLDGVFQKFNLEHPPEFIGHSLSVSDVVEVVDSPKLVGKLLFYKPDGSFTEKQYTDMYDLMADTRHAYANGSPAKLIDLQAKNILSVEAGFYYCDSFGFKKIDFEPEKTLVPDIEKISVVMVEPGKEARMVDLCTDLKAVQHAVGGYIECMYPFEDDAVIVCNEEGKVNGSKLNRAIYMDGQMVDIIAGTFFICSAPSESETFESLSSEQANTYLEMFKEPEQFYRGFDGKIKAEKIKTVLSAQIDDARKNVSDSAESKVHQNLDRDM